ncbi:protein kinase [Candidatus Woesearchaeota archaeon]|nr:protein kinase [Candidatus Woesearchaeota archaeon]
MSNDQEIFAAEGNSDRGRNSESSRIKGFDRKRWDSEGFKLPPKPSEHFKPGALVKDGLCQIVKSIGSGGMCEVFAVTINNYWEVLRQHLLQGDIEKLWQYTGINSDDVKSGAELTARQRQNVDKVIAQFKKQYGEEFPPEMMGYIDEKLRGGTAVLKVLVPSKTEDERENENDIIRLQQEASVMKYDLNHPNIIKVFHYFISDGYHCILEELKDGAKSLAAVLANYEQELSKAEIAFIGSSVFDAICHSHEKGILWRDCNPKNILVVYDEAEKRINGVKAIDWGIAKRLRESGIESLLEDTTTKKHNISVTGKKNIVGTPQYLSPEQVENTKAVGKPTDLFSLGSTLYLAVTRTMAFAGKDEYEIAFNLTLPDPEKNPQMPNLVIKEQRETAVQNRQMEEFKSDEPLPSYVSEEFEDLIMMLLEKDEKNRIRSDYVAELFKNIHKDGLYEKEEESPESVQEKNEAAMKVLGRAEELESQLGKVPEGNEMTSALLDIASEYEKAAHLIPRQIDEDTLPDFSRMDAFAKAAEYYTKAMESYRPVAGEARIDTEHLEDKIHRIGCHLRVEFMRADQMRLLKSGEKIAKKEPKSMHRLFGTGYVLSKLQSALQFLEKGMFVAARKEWEDADRYAGKNKGVSANAYMQMNNFKNTLADMKEKANYEVSISRGIQTIKRLIELRRFKDAEPMIEGVYLKASDNKYLSEKSGEFIKTIELLEKFNRSSEEEYARFQEIARAAGVERDNLRKMRADLRAGNFFPKSALDDARAATDSVMGEYHTIDRVLAGEAQCTELERTFEEIREAYGAVSVQLAKTLFLNASEKIGMLSKLNPQIDKYDPDVMQKIGQVQELIAHLEGDTGLGSIETGEGYVPADRVKELKDRLKVEKDRFWMLSEDVRHFELLKEKAESGSDQEKIEACTSLVFSYIAEKGDLDKAAFYFSKMPGYARNKKDGRAMDAETYPLVLMFEAYQKIRDESRFLRKTPGGLDERVVKHLEYLGSEHIAKLMEREERNDPGFDTELKLLCGYTGTDAEAIIAIRHNIDQTYESMNRLSTEIQSFQAQPEQYSAHIGEREEQIRKLNSHLKQQEGNYAGAIGAVLESAKKKIESEGTRQPEDVMDYITVATYLRDLAKDHRSREAKSLAKELYAKYISYVPEGSREADIARQNIAYLDSLA